MPQPDYVVATRYEVNDASSGTLRQMQREQRTLTGDVGRTKAAFIGLGGAVAGLFAGNWVIRQAKHLVELNERAYQTRLGIAALLATLDKSKLGGTEKFNKAFERTPEVMRQLREMAARGLGTSAEYIQTFRTLVKPIDDMGGGMERALETTKLLVPVAKLLQIPVQQAGYEMRNLMMGRALSRSLLPRMLAISAKEANNLAKTNPGKLLDRITLALEKYRGASEKAGESLDAQMATLQDAKTQLLKTLGGPLSEEVTRAVKELVGLIHGNQGDIDAWVKSTGKDIGETFKAGFGYAKDATAFIFRHWHEIAVTAKAILETWLAIKAVQAAGAIWQAGGAAFGSLGGLMARGNLSLGASLLGAGAAPLESSAIGAAAALRGGVGSASAMGGLLLPLGQTMGMLSIAFGVAASGVAGWEIGQWLNSLGADEAVFKLIRAFGHSGLSYDEEQARAKAQVKAAMPAQAWGHVANLMKAHGVRAGGYDLAAELEGKDTWTTAMNKQFKRQAMDAVAGLVMAAKTGATMEGRAEDVSPEARKVWQGLAKRPVREREEAYAIIAAHQKGLYGGNLGVAPVSAEGLAAIKTSLGLDDKGEVAKRPPINFPNAKFEIKLDARDLDPDDVAISIERWVYRSTEYAVSSRLSPVGA